jgi:type I restriction enzyme S subunit
MKWPVEKLGAYIDVVMGQAPLSDTCNKEGNGVVFVKAGEFGYESPLIREWTTNPLKMAEVGDSLVCVVGATAGKINRSKFDCAIGRSVAAIRSTSKDLLQDFLHSYLKTKIIELRNKSQGAAQAVITREMLQLLEISLPPLEEQQRIARILDTADRLMQLRESAIAKLDQLALSAFNKIQHTSTDKSRIDRLFEINNNRIVNGIKDEDLVSFVPMSSVSEKSKRIEIHNVKKFLDVKKGYTPIRRGDLLIAKITPCYENGKIAIANNLETEIGFGSTEFHTLRCDNPLLTLFAYYFLQRESIRFVGAKNMKGAAGQRRVPADFFAELEIPLPNAKALNEFSKQISSLQRRREVMELAQNKLSDLKNSLQHQSFSVN